MAEQFNFGIYTWDVDKAKRLIANTPRKPVRVSVEKLRQNQSLITVDPSHARKANLRNPGILGWLYIDGQWFNILIDGNHRLYKAAELKRKTLPVYLLSKEENYEIVSGPAREQLNPAKTYIADYQALLSRKSPSRDRFYRSRISEFLDELSEEDWQKEVGNFQKLHRKLIVREDPIEPDRAEFQKLEKLIQKQKCTAGIDIDWIYFGGQIETVKSRAYFNISPESFSAPAFCEFINWFVATCGQVAYAKIPSAFFASRFYECHDSFIFYTSLDNDEKLYDILETCLDKLVELGFEIETTPSELYVQPEPTAKTSFHLELARAVQDVLLQDILKFDDVVDFADHAAGEISLEGSLTKKLLEKNLIL